ncbi:cation diffusion facilitator family transporter [Rubrobacter calidifluminis]|uniref:cation diffusion facilitator family transporter n=1 Tax=Rubrobacter calidifluminis TaxID=1392640 RepID=UPI00235FF2DC|nr:cation diffusion facilitator family transporter [Rubrobacter calidifluminis]
MSAAGEGHEGHDHRLDPGADRRYLAVALCLIGAFTLAEGVLGFFASSLALLSDAGHMLTDAGALALALVTMRLAQRPAHGIMTYGLKRSEIVSAQINGVSLLVLSALFYYEGIVRLLHPPRVEGGLVLVVGLAGIGVNLLATFTLAKANRESLNVEGSFQHILTDLYSFIATTIAGGIIYFTGGYYRADALAALVIATIMLRAGFGLVRDSGRIFMEAAPKGLDPDEIGHVMISHPGIVNVHDLHVWEVTSGFPALSAHVLVGRNEDCHRRRRELEGLLEERFGISHTTLQVDHETPELLDIPTKDGTEGARFTHPH